MTVQDWLSIGWLAAGVALGLVAANWMYDDDDGDRGFMAALAFVFCVALFPIIAGVLVLAGLFYAGGWLLPSRRRELRKRRDGQRTTSAARSRAEIDRLHTELGLPPVNWRSDE